MKRDENFASGIKNLSAFGGLEVAHRLFTVNRIIVQKYKYGVEY